MAKKKSKDEEKMNYVAELRRLNDAPPERLYFMWGPEDYLREDYLTRLKQKCLPEGEDGFSYKRIDNTEIDINELQIAIDAMPFMTDRTFIEIRGAELNSAKNGDELLKVLSDIPEYCTVAIVENTQFEPDGRLKLIKGIRAIAKEMKFVQQSQEQLINWVRRRFAAAGKTIELDAIQRLIFVSGDLMNRLIPEIEKIAAYAKTERVTVEDIDAVANRIPEADVFSITNLIAQRKYNQAMSTLADLMSDKSNDPILLLAIIGTQIRRLYAARLAIEKNLGTKYVMDACSIRLEFIARQLIASARGYTMPALIRAVELCEETDYRMKSSGENTEALLRETVLRIAVGENG